MPSHSQLLAKASLGVVLLWLMATVVREILQQQHVIRPTVGSVRPLVAKVCVLYGEDNGDYGRAIASHERHAALHNYPIHVLTRPVAEGYWNKELYPLSILIQELGKSKSDRVEWLMWFDADSIIINPHIRLESFLPSPHDATNEYHVLATKDQNGLNTGIFFLRVHQWSVNMLVRTMTTPIFRPDVDLCHSADQMAMVLLFNQTGDREHVLYLPRTWYNAYEWAHAYEGREGNILVHFPGLEEARSQHVRDWLDVVEGPRGEKWQVPFEETHYPQEIDEIWRMVHEGRQRLDEAESMLAQVGNSEEATAVVERL